MGSFSQNLSVLLWKNFRLKHRSPCKTVCEIVVPIILIIIIMLFILLLALVTKDFGMELPLDPRRNLNCSRITTINYVKGSEFVTKIMEEIKTVLQGKERKFKEPVTLHSFKTESEMLKAMDTPDRWDKCNLGVIFKDGKEINMASKDIKVTIRSCMKYQDLTSPLYNIPYSQEHSYLERRNTFVEFQHALVEAVLNLHKAANPKFNINFERFPVRKVKIKSLTTFGFTLVVPLLLLLTFCFHCYIIVATVGKEKEHQLKESMKGIGLSTGLQWFSWFITYFVVLLILACFLVIALTSVKRNYSILTESDGAILLLFLVLAISVIIVMCLMISTFFNKAFYGALTCFLSWFACFVIYFMIGFSDYYKIGLSVKLLLCIIPYLGIMLGLRIFGQFEITGEGMQWKYIFRKLDCSEDLTLGVVMTMLLFDIIFFISIALYVDSVFPGKYGIPKPWNFLCKASFWKSDYKPELQAEEVEHNENFEAEPTDKPVAISIQHLSKNYGSHEVVKDMNLKMYEGQITVLLGHNGAGKTTTMSMVTGILKSTKGTVIVGEYDILTNVQKIRLNMGLCPQHNILFENLTVVDHLYFYAKLKGLRGHKLHDDISKYLHVLNLNHVGDTKSKKLSGGEQRKLSVGVALCGDSKFVILDEPSSGMDPTARRQLWDLLEVEKRNRVIMLSTHFMDEADALGDRIAIMHNGILECCGSPFFLKKKYGAGYKLTIVKLPDCVTENVTQALQRRIPEIKLKEERRSEITYQLRDEDSGLFEDLLSNLEQNQKSLNVESFGLSVTTMEEVFLKVGSPESDRKTNEHKELLLINLDLMGRYTTWIYQIFALLMKRALYAWRSWLTLLLILLLPGYLGYFIDLDDISGKSFATFTYPPITIDSKLYTDLVTPIEMESLSSEMKSIANAYKRKTDGFIVEDITQHVLEVIDEDPLKVRGSYVIGASFEGSDNIIVWYNVEADHSVPFSLLMIENIILKKYAGMSLTVVNHALPETSYVISDEIKYVTQAGQIVVHMCICISFYIIFYVRERRIKAKHLQFTSGVPVLIYWTVNYIWDIFFYLLSVIFFITVLYISNKNYPYIDEFAGAIAIALISFGFCMLPLIYLLSYITKSYTGSYVLVAGISFILNYLYYLTFMHNKINKEGLHKWGFIYIPLCSLLEYIVKLCKACDTGHWTGFYDFEDGVGYRIVFFIIEGIFFFILLLLIDYDAFWVLLYLMTSGEKGTGINMMLDLNVIQHAEMIRAADINELKKTHDVVLKNMNKSYKHTKVVDHLYLAVEKGECFGFLGANGAGKTTTFKMTLGDITIDSGDIYLHGHSMKAFKIQPFNYVGYCPQFDAVLPEMTVGEIMYMYALIRGIPVRSIRDAVYELADIMLFSEHLNTKIEKCSGGTKRKVSAAIGILAKPSLIFLDEPTTGIDPEAKRKIWDLLSAIRESGSCIILCSHSMDECEALCSRLTIMVRGKMRCLGSIQHLKSTFSREYTLIIKGKMHDLGNVPPVPDEANGIYYVPEDPCQMSVIKNFIEQNFPESYLREERRCFVTYGIRTDMPLSKVFGLMENAKNTIIFEDYSLGQSTLEQVFLLLTKEQTDITPVYTEP